MGAIDPVVSRQHVKTKSASVESRVSPYQHHQQLTPSIRCSAINLHESSPEDDDDDEDEFFYYKKTKPKPHDDDDDDAHTGGINNRDYQRYSNFNKRSIMSKKLEHRTQSIPSATALNLNSGTGSTSQDSLATATSQNINSAASSSSASPSAATRAKNFLCVAMGGFSPLRPAASASCLFTSPSAMNLSNFSMNHDEGRRKSWKKHNEKSNTTSSNALASIPTRASLTHDWRKLRTPNKCRECNMFVYFNGRECSYCSFIAHKKCLISLVIKCSGCLMKSSAQATNLSLSMRGRHPQNQSASQKKVSITPIYGQSLDSVDGEQILDFIRRFIYEIDTRGLTSKGIYRVSSIKSKVDRLCLCYDQNPTNLIDLSSFHPNIIANALKVYLRQLPEPLFTNGFYHEFISLAKKYPETSSSSDKKQNPSSSSSCPSSSSSSSNSISAPTSPSGTSHSSNRLMNANAARPHPGIKRSNAIQERFIHPQHRQISSTSLPLNTTSIQRPIQQQQPQQQQQQQQQCASQPDHDHDNHNQNQLSKLLQDLKVILDHLPPLNKQIIGSLMRHLRRVADMSDENQMSAKNLGIIFGPTLLNLENNKSLAIVDNIHQARLIELMITWAYEIFPQDALDDVGDHIDANNYIQPDYSSHVSY